MACKHVVSQYQAKLQENWGTVLMGDGQGWSGAWGDDADMGCFGAYAGIVRCSVLPGMVLCVEVLGVAHCTGAWLRTSGPGESQFSAWVFDGTGFGRDCRHVFKAWRVSTIDTSWVKS